jgi:hypothetical protein
MKSPSFSDDFGVILLRGVLGMGWQSPSKLDKRQSPRLRTVQICAFQRVEAHGSLLTIGPAM